MTNINKFIFQASDRFMRCVQCLIFFFYYIYLGNSCENILSCNERVFYTLESIEIERLHFDHLIFYYEKQQNFLSDLI